MSKIDFSNLKGAFKLLGVLRACSALVWPAVITVAAVLVFVVALLMGSSFKKKVEKESIPMAEQVKRLAETAIPVGQVEVEKRYQQQYQEDANRIEQMAIQSTQRELISYGIFPEPNGTSAMLFIGAKGSFGVRYREAIEGLVAKVRGGICPSEAELKASTQKSRVGERGYWMDSDTEESRIIEQICEAKAKAASVYISPLDVSGYDFWDKYEYKNREQAVEDCWFWQIGYWIIEDVFSTIEAMNAGSSAVRSSTVKRLMGVGFVTPDRLFTGQGKITTASQQRPGYVSKPEEQLTEACTARISSDDIDVVHFSIIVVVSDEGVMPFIKQLCTEKTHSFVGYRGDEQEKVFRHNQITVLESRVRSVQKNSEPHQYYRYGHEQVFELELVCEYIFKKKGYETINPLMAKNNEMESQEF